MNSQIAKYVQDVLSSNSEFTNTRKRNISSKLKLRMYLVNILRITFRTRKRIQTYLKRRELL